MLSFSDIYFPLTLSLFETDVGQSYFIQNNLGINVRFTFSFFWKTNTGKICPQQKSLSNKCSTCRTIYNSHMHQLWIFLGTLWKHIFWYTDMLMALLHSTVDPHCMLQSATVQPRLTHSTLAWVPALGFFSTQLHHSITKPITTSNRESTCLKESISKNFKRYSFNKSLSSLQSHSWSPKALNDSWRANDKLIWIMIF